MKTELLEKLVDRMLDSETQQSSGDHFFKVGKKYFIRTVTNYFTGELVRATPEEIVLNDVAWVENTGRYADFLRGATVGEVEPYPDGRTVLVNRRSIVDASEWVFELLRVQK